jgi:hypothetical protein
MAVMSDTGGCSPISRSARARRSGTCGGLGSSNPSSIRGGISCGRYNRYRIAVCAAAALSCAPVSLANVLMPFCPGGDLVCPSPIGEAQIDDKKLATKNNGRVMFLIVGEHISMDADAIISFFKTYLPLSLQSLPQ